MNTDLIDAQIKLLENRLQTEPHTLQLWAKKNKGFWEVRKKGKGEILKKSKTKVAADKFILVNEFVYIKAKSQEKNND